MTRTDKDRALLYNNTGFNTHQLNGPRSVPPIWPDLLESSMHENVSKIHYYVNKYRIDERDKLFMLVHSTPVTICYDIEQSVTRYKS